MEKQRGGYGFVVLIVVLAIVRLLAAHVWKKVAPGELGGAPAANPEANPATAGQIAPLESGVSDAMAPAPANGPAATERARDVREQVNSGAADVKKALEQTP